MQLLKLSILLALIISANSFADELGRLFYTPQHRQLMNQYRLNPPIAQPIEKPKPPLPIIKIPDKIQFNGIFFQHSKKPLIWINQQEAPWEGIQFIRYLHKEKRLLIQLNDNSRIKLRMGETWKNKNR